MRELTRAIVFYIESRLQKVQALRNARRMEDKGYLYSYIKKGDIKECCNYGGTILCCIALELYKRIIKCKLKM